jgi:hypothetical protein
MAFKDAGEVRKYIGGIFETAFADPEIGPKLAATGVVLGSRPYPVYVDSLERDGRADLLV